jgi:hypothetical protein
MAEPNILDRAFHAIITRRIDTGQAPRHVERAAQLGVPVREGRKALRSAS